MVGGRRRVLEAIAVGALAPLASRVAASSHVKRVANLTPHGDEPPTAAYKAAFAEAFVPLGFRVGQNLEMQWFDFPMYSDHEVILPPLIARLVATRPDCIVTAGDFCVRYLQRATKTIPIVANLWVGDPVDLGFARSYAHPGGNVTGLHAGEAELHLKRMQLLKAVAPSSTCIAWIAFNPQLTWFPTFEKAAAASGLRVRKVLIPGIDAPALDSLRREIASLRAEGCRIAHFHSSVPPVVKAVAAAAKESRLALSYTGESPFSTEGLLFHYEPLFQAAGYDNKGRFAAMVARVLRGERPADIAFEGPVAYRLRLNLKTAAAIGVTVPPDVRLLADEIAQ